MCGRDFFLAFSPEREDPGRKDFDTKTTAKVVGGVDADSTELAVALYRTGVAKVVPVSCARVAESAKLLENVFRSVNIALVNELKIVFDRMGIDVWEVIEAAKTKPFGFMPFYPGPGLGGHCIPLDPFYLSWKAAEHGQWARFVELAGEINTGMPRWVVAKVAEALNEDAKPVKGSHPRPRPRLQGQLDDDRESPSYEIIELLQERRDCRLLRPVLPRDAEDAQAGAGDEVRGEGRGDLEGLRRGGGLHRPRPLQGPGALRGACRWWWTRATSWRRSSRAAAGRGW